ncbi:uncharacterized protein LOC133515857 [Cydia pomonella]|uniref:uncharacterized protein LOC133515857 n=1 Tax=Cydia pomonella TaxID=82600 RepID=UPI002ADE1DC4|nr:uncharacterized protein LOC133515857 [Cydia pomonella]
MLQNKAGNQLSLYQGYTFYCLHTNKSGTKKVWACTNKSQGCRARFHLLQDSYIIKCQSQHSHKAPKFVIRDVQIIRTHLGKEQVLYDGYTYYCNVTSANGWKKYWRCTRGGGSGCCAARLHLSQDYKVMKIINEHRHPPPRFIIRNGVYTKIG